MTRHNNQRRHRRVPGRIPVTLITPRNRAMYLTENFSQAGIFVRTDTPTALRKLIKVVFSPTGSAKPLQMLAMVVYTITPEQSKRLGRSPGIGLNLYGLDPKTRGAWEDFVHNATLRLEKRNTAPTARTTFVEPIRRQHPRSEASFQVRAETTRQLFDLYTHDISLGGTFLRSDADVSRGDTVQLLFVHPNNQSEFTLQGEVIRTVKAPPEEKGFAVRFQTSEPETLGFHRFVESGLPFMGEELDLLDTDLIVEEDDPMLL